MSQNELVALKRQNDELKQHVAIYRELIELQQEKDRLMQENIDLRRELALYREYKSLVERREENERQNKHRSLMQRLFGSTISN
jgi:hypothetical protein